jgi:hypothetical protein
MSNFQSRRTGRGAWFSTTVHISEGFTHMRDRAENLITRLLLLRDKLLDPPFGAYPAPRPDELIMCVLCLLSGFPTLFGNAPVSIEAALWPPLRYVWAVALILLPVVIIWTSLARWRGQTDLELIDSGESFRQASRMLALAAFSYAICLLWFTGITASVAIALLFGFGLGRLWRSFEMGRWLKHVRLL